MKKFFDFLRRKDIVPARMRKKISKLSDAQLIDFIHNCAEKLPKRKEVAKSPFEFVANTKYSGGQFPCAAFECRVSHIDTMARFASLYADHVLIQDPLSKYRGLNHVDDHVKLHFEADLTLLLHIQPLLEAEIIGIAASEFHFCKDCASKKNEEVRKKLLRAKNYLKKIISKNITYSLDAYRNMPFIEKSDATDRLCNDSKIIVLNPATLKKISNLSPHVLSKEEIRELRLLDKETEPFLNDIFIHNFYSDLYRANYLTDREIDFDLIKFLNNDEANLVSNAITESFRHSLPCIQTVDLSKLLKLRTKESEAFRVYRDAMSLSLKTVAKENYTKKTSLEVFNDIVQPELNSIDAVVKKSKKLLLDSLRSDLIIGSGFVTVGLYSGILPTNIGALIAALGGYKFASSFVDKANRALKEPPEARDSKFYFLWKVKQLSKKQNAKDPRQKNRGDRC